MVLYECHVKDSSAWFDHHAGASGEACYSPNMPPEWTFCLATNAWAWVNYLDYIMSAECLNICEQKMDSGWSICSQNWF